MKISKILNNFIQNNIDYEVFNYTSDKSINIKRISLLNNLDISYKNNQCDFEIIFYEENINLLKLIDVYYDYNTVLIIINCTKKIFLVDFNNMNQMIILINQKITMIELWELFDNEPHNIIYNCINRDVNKLYSLEKCSLDNISNLLFYYLGCSVGLLEENNYLLKQGDYIQKEKREISYFFYDYKQNDKDFEIDEYNNKIMNYKDKIIIFRELVLSNNKIGILFIVQDKKKETLYISEILTAISPYYILASIKEGKINTTFNLSEKELIENIIFGIIEDKSTIIESCKYLNMNYEDKRFIWILEYTNKDGDKNNDRNIDVKYIFKIINRVFPNNISIHSTNKIISVQNKSSKPNYEMKLIFENIVEKLRLDLPNFTFKLGISKAYQTLKGLKKAYNDAIFSLEIGKEYVYSKNGIFYYDDIILYHLIINIIDNPIIIRIYLNSIPILLKYDGENEENLVKVITTLVKNNYNIKKTSEELFMHRNTLYDRITRIEKLLEINLYNQNYRVLIYIALKIYEVILVNEQNAI